MKTQGYLPPVLINSFPKSGTYLVANTLNFMGFQYKEPFLARNLRNHILNIRYWRHSETCMVGVGQPNTIKFQTLYRLLRTIYPGYYRLGHIPHQIKVADQFEKLGLKTIFVIRDPRDIIVSQAHYYIKHPSHFLYRYYRSETSVSDRITLAITGIYRNNHWVTHGIANKIQRILGWIETDGVFTIHFEDIVGPKGGGSEQLQYKTILELSNFLGLSLSKTDIQQMGEYIFGKGRTFHRGQIGSWRNFLTEDQKLLVKECIGESLIGLGFEKDNHW